MDDDYTPTITAPNVSEGMVLQFAGESGVSAGSEVEVQIWEAEVAHVERPDGLGDWGFWVTPEDSEVQFFVWARKDKAYPIVG